MSYPSIPNALTTTPTPAWVRNAGKPWRAPRLTEDGKPFEPKAFEPGASCTFRDRDGNTVTGQVWSGHIYPKTRWVVADGTAYEVHERDLIVAPNNDPHLI